MTKTDGVREQIKKLLFAKQVTRDHPLTEEGLTRLFGVSRAPVREALRELERERIIERKQGKGIYLRRPSAKEIAELYDIRMGLEGIAGRLAAERVNDQDLRTLGALAREYDEGLREGNGAKERAADVAFHRKIAELSGNAQLLKIMDDFFVLERAFVLGFPAGRRPVVPQRPASSYPHQAIVTVLRKRDVEKAEKVIRLHMRHSKQAAIDAALQNGRF